jgi:hypothetical protein
MNCQQNILHHILYPISCGMMVARYRPRVWNNLAQEACVGDAITGLCRRHKPAPILATANIHGGVSALRQKAA